jgi:hypothetical protein
MKLAAELAFPVSLTQTVVSLGLEPDFSAGKTERGQYRFESERWDRGAGGHLSVQMPGHETVLLSSSPRLQPANEGIRSLVSSELRIASQSGKCGHTRVSVFSSEYRGNRQQLSYCHAIKWMWIIWSL